MSSSCAAHVASSCPRRRHASFRRTGKTVVLGPPVLLECRHVMSVPVHHAAGIPHPLHLAASLSAMPRPVTARGGLSAAIRHVALGSKRHSCRRYRNPEAADTPAQRPRHWKLLAPVLSRRARTYSPPRGRLVLERAQAAAEPVQPVLNRLSAYLDVAEFRGMSVLHLHFMSTKRSQPAERRVSDGGRTKSLVLHANTSCCGAFSKWALPWLLKRPTITDHQRLVRNPRTQDSMLLDDMWILIGKRHAFGIPRASASTRTPRDASTRGP